MAAWNWSLRGIARFAELAVPFMGVGYILVALVVTAINITEVPAMLGHIISAAFGLEEGGAVDPYGLRVPFWIPS